MHAELQRVCDRFRSELSGIDPASTQLHPAQDSQRWCIQQIVEHLLLTYRLTSDALQRRLDKGTGTTVRSRFPQVLARTLVLRIGYFPSGRRSPEAVFPQPSANPCGGEALADRMREGLTAMDALLVAAEGQFGNAPLQAHMVFGPLTANEWRRFHAMHALHHLKQIRSLRHSITAAGS